MEISLIIVLGGLALFNMFWWFAMYQERIRLTRLVRLQVELIKHLRFRR